MVKITDKDYYMDGYLKTNLDKAKGVIDQNWDFIFIVDGKERRGKTVIAQQMAYYCDPTFNLDRMVFNTEQFYEAVDKAEKFQAIVFDEAYSATNTSSAMSKVAVALKTKLTMIGKKNLYIFIVLPPFFDLNKYIAIWRSVALIHVYTGENFQRGFFAFYDDEQKKKLYIFGKREYNYGVAKSNFYGRFTDFWIVDREQYEKKKDAAILKETETGFSLRENIWKQRASILARKLCELGFTQKKVGSFIEMADQHISELINTPTGLISTPTSN